MNTILLWTDGLRDDFEISHEIFRDAFSEGFPWEVLKVLRGPPEVIFTWRHWGKFVGTYRGRQVSISQQFEWQHFLKTRLFLHAELFFRTLKWSSFFWNII